MKMRRPPKPPKAPTGKRQPRKGPAGKAPLGGPRKSKNAINQPTASLDPDDLPTPEAVLAQAQELWDSKDVFGVTALAGQVTILVEAKARRRKALLLTSHYHCLRFLLHDHDALFEYCANKVWESRKGRPRLDSPPETILRSLLWLAYKGEPKEVNDRVHRDSMDLKPALQADMSPAEVLVELQKPRRDRFGGSGVLVDASDDDSEEAPVDPVDEATVLDPIEDSSVRSDSRGGDNASQTDSEGESTVEEKTKAKDRGQPTQTRVYEADLPIGKSRLTWEVWERPRSKRGRRRRRKS